jgi:hypothetical protein
MSQQSSPKVALIRMDLPRSHVPNACCTATIRSRHCASLRQHLMSAVAHVSSAVTFPSRMFATSCLSAQNSSSAHMPLFNILWI